MKLNLFMGFFFFGFEMPLKVFPFYSPIILTLWFRYLPTRVKEVCVFHLLSQLKFQEKCFFQLPADLNFKNFTFGVYRTPPHGAIELSKQ